MKYNIEITSEKEIEKCADCPLSVRDRCNYDMCAANDEYLTEKDMTIIRNVKCPIVPKNPTSDF